MTLGPNVLIAISFALVAVAIITGALQQASNERRIRKLEDRLKMADDPASIAARAEQQSTQRPMVFGGNMTEEERAERRAIRRAEKDAERARGES